MIGDNIFEIPNDWEYRGEGNSHLVLGLPKLKMILRIRKRDKPRGLFQWFLLLIYDFFCWWYDSYSKIEQRDINFHLKVMRPLLGCEYVSDAKQVKLSTKQAKIIEEQLMKIRPDFRKHRILHFGRATLFHDFTILETKNVTAELGDDTFSVEIKPKKGWIPFSEKCFPECIFCMNQYLKLETGRITKSSSYCPKNLFSGDEMKVKKSILSLIDNPQNNLRIFKNGIIVYDENKDSSEVEDVMRQIFDMDNVKLEMLLKSFCEVIFKCLTRRSEPLPQCKAKLFCKWDQTILGDSFPSGCILERILSVQMLDVEGTKYYNKVLTDKISEWGYVKNLIDELDSKMCVKCALLTLTNSENLRRKDLIFAPYLVAAVANDCSLMITMRKVRKEKFSHFRKLINDQRTILQQQPRWS
ncbi:hypothetical protein WA026_008382 [Henosepilachna vigintioctopunctata]|uniref:Inositol-pentakisphosphate 2-kinase n=1 Tax=Henosepilachna vigintioctopunctata TaxID=420089 RepID=A0AAW1U817_9CUCU